jgi:DNA polymerase III subunit delta
VAGALKKDSKLKVAAEVSQRFSVTAFYEETGSAVLLRIQTVMKQRGFAFAECALERFVDLCGSDRSVLLNEAEKLALYCHPHPTITIDDVEAACGDQAEFEADQLIVAVLDGEMERADRIYASMVQSGDAKSVLIMMQMYLARLECVSAGLPAKPPFFGPQQAISGRQLRVLNGDDLGRMQVSVQQAILQSRQMADLGDAIAGRCLMSLARMVRQLKVQAA